MNGKKLPITSQAPLDGCGNDSLDYSDTVSFFTFYAPFKYKFSVFKKFDKLIKQLYYITKRGISSKKGNYWMG